MKSLTHLLFAAIMLPASLWAATINGQIRIAPGTTAITTGAKVVLYNGVGAGAVAVDSTTADTLGNYTFTGVTVGPKQIQASASGYNSNVGVIGISTAGQTSTVNISLFINNKTSVISGTVLDSLYGTPVGNALVTLTGGANNVNVSVMADGSGMYEFDSVATDSVGYTVSASAANYLARNTTGVTTTWNAATAADVNIVPVANIIGKVSITGTGGVAVPGAKIVLQSRPNNTTAYAPIDSTVSDANGLYQFSGLAAVTGGTAGGNYRIMVWDSVYVTFTSGNLTVAVGGTNTTNAALTVMIPGSISGRVINLAAQPIANVVIYLRRGSAAAAIIDSATTNDTGGYTLSSVGAGLLNYWVTAGVSGYVSVSDTNIAVPNGGTGTANFVLVASGISRNSLSNSVQGIRMVRVGNDLILDLGVTNITRTVSIYDLNGIRHSRIAIQPGESRAVVPAAYAPTNGFLFQVK